MSDDTQLLRQFVEEHSEEAFAALVQHHVDLVYSAALRQLGGDAHLAWDASQGVFLALAQSAPRLLHHRALTGWLYTTTRFICAKIVRTRQRTRAREQAAFSMNEILGAGAQDADWSAVHPLLDTAMRELSAADREAVLLRHFEGRSFSDIGRLWGLSENAAHMRVERAIEKLRARLVRCGITSTATALGAVLSANAIGSAPAGLASAAATLAFAGSTSAVGAAGMLTSLQLMSAPFLKTVAAAAVLAVATGGIYLGTRHTRGTPESTSTTAPRSAREFAAPVASAVTRTGITKAPVSADNDSATRASGNAASDDMLASLNAAQKAMTASIRTGLDQRYGRLFRRLSLTPADLERFRDLLTERELSPFEAMAVAQAHGIKPFNNPEEFAAVIAKVRSDVDQNIRAFLGDARFSVFQDHNAHAPAYFLFDVIEGRLGNTSAPLQESQTEPLLRILDAAVSVPADPAFANGPFAWATMMSNDPSAAALARGPISDDTLARAQLVLSPPQIEVLRRIQAEQRDQVESMKAVTDSLKRDAAANPQR